MKRHLFAWTIACATAGLWLAAAAWSGQKAADDAGDDGNHATASSPASGAPTSAPAKESGDSAEPDEESSQSAEGWDALKRARDAYRSAVTYQDKLHCTARVVWTSEAEADVGYLDGSLAYRFPCWLASKTDLLHVYRDAERLIRYSPTRRQYAVDPPEDGLFVFEPSQWDRYGYTGLHPLVALLHLTGYSIQETTSIISVTGIQPETCQGRSGHRLTGFMRVRYGAEPVDAPFTLLIDDQTQLFREFRLDATVPYRAWLKAHPNSGDAANVDSADVVMTFSDVVIGGDIPADTFKFDAAGIRRVRHFADTTSQGPSPSNLVGNAAPPLAGRTVDGQDFDLATLQGRTVVVLFWATSSPHARDALDYAQFLTFALADQPLTVVGVNRNGPAGDSAAAKMSAERQATFPQIRDAEARIASSWQVSALPTMFVVAPDGTIAETSEWQWTAAREELAAKLASLLSSPRQSDAPEPAVPPSRLVIAERLVPLTSEVPTSQPGDERLAAEDLGAGGSRWHMSQQDVDGDGEIEIILPNWSATINVVKPSTGDVEQVRLPLSKGFSVTSAQALTIDGDRCWLCIVERSPSDDEQRPQPRVAARLYSPAGELLWSFVPDVSEKAETNLTAAAGDLDGDGAPEFAVGCSTYRLTPTAQNPNVYNVHDQRDWLAVLNRRGQTIAQADLPGQVDVLFIPATKPGKPTHLFCIAGSRLHRFQLKPEAR